MPVTRGGIYHNLRESKYTISNSEIVFFFSSELYLNKFLREYQKNRESYKKFMKRGYNPLNTDILADIETYEEIEKRGFFVRFKRDKISKEDLYKYALRKMLDSESLNWERMVLK
jgi:Phi-29-like late genes activator (early protein GP4)